MHSIMFYEDEQEMDLSLHHHSLRRPLSLSPLPRILSLDSSSLQLKWGSLQAKC